MASNSLQASGFRVIQVIIVNENTRVYKEYLHKLAF